MRVFNSHTPDPKEEALLARWTALGFTPHAADPLSVAQLYPLHDATYAMQASQVGNHPQMDALGAVYAAALYAATHGQSAIAGVRCGAEAGYHVSTGPEPFNALVLAATVALAHGHKKVAILSCDADEGRGIEDCLRGAKLADRINVYTVARWYKHAPHTHAFLDSIEGLLHHLCHSCTYLVYGAGCEVLRDFGSDKGWLHLNAIKQRDLAVLKATRKFGRSMCILTGDGEPTSAVLDVQTHLVQAAQKILDSR